MCQQENVQMELWFIVSEDEGLFVWSLFDFYHAIRFRYLELFSKIIGAPEEKHFRHQEVKCIFLAFPRSLQVNHSHPDIDFL